ncbi:hypothetical protein Tco_1376620 [Tanacetum coccineum]
MPDDEIKSLSGGIGAEDATSGPFGDDNDEDMATSEHSSKQALEFLMMLPLNSTASLAVSDDIKSSVPAMIRSALQDQLPGLLAEALQGCLPQLQKQVIKPINKKFNTYHVAESLHFVTLQKSLSKVLKSEMGTSVSEKVRSGMQDVRADLDSQIKHLGKYCSDVQAESLIPSEPTAETKGEQPPELVVADKTDENKQLAIHSSEEKKLDDIVAVSDDSDDDDLDKQPLSKRFKIVIELPTPIPLMLVVLEPIKQQTFHDFTNKLFETTSSSFSPTPPNPPREPTPPRDPSKGKGVSHEEEQGNILVPFQQEGGSNLELPKLKLFSTPELTLSREEFKAQLIEMERLEKLKAEQEKSERGIKKLFNPATLKAQAQKADPLPITKISYIVNKNKEPTMRITRDNDPLNLVVLQNFRLRSLGFSEWLEVHALASKKSGSSINQLLTSLRAKKRTEMIKQVFVTENVVADGCQRNITPPAGVEGKNGKVIREPEAGFFYYNGNFDLVYQRESEFHITSTVQLIRLQRRIVRDSPEADEIYQLMNLDFPSYLDGNHQLTVRDIVKEVEDYLKTYSSAEKDIS